MRRFLPLLAATALSTVVSVPMDVHAQTYQTRSRALKPSIEINLDVLNTLRPAPVSVPEKLASRPWTPPESKSRPETKPAPKQASIAAPKPAKQPKPKPAEPVVAPVEPAPLPLPAAPPAAPPPPPPPPASPAQDLLPPPAAPLPPVSPEIPPAPPAGGPPPLLVPDALPSPAPEMPPLPPATSEQRKPVNIDIPQLAEARPAPAVEVTEPKPKPLPFAEIPPEKAPPAMLPEKMPELPALKMEEKPAELSVQADADKPAKKDDKSGKKSEKKDHDKKESAKKQGKDELVVFKNDKKSPTLTNKKEEAKPLEQAKKPEENPPVPAAFEPLPPAQPLPPVTIPDAALPAEKMPELPGTTLLPPPAPEMPPVPDTPPPPSAAVPPAPVASETGAKPAAAEEQSMFSGFKKSFGSFIGAEPEAAPTPVPPTPPVPPAPPAPLAEIAPPAPVPPAPVTPPAPVAPPAPDVAPPLPTPPAMPALEPVKVPEKKELSKTDAPPMPPAPLPEPAKEDKKPEPLALPKIEENSKADTKKDGAPALPPLALLDKPSGSSGADVPPPLPDVPAPAQNAAPALPPLALLNDAPAKPAEPKAKEAVQSEPKPAAEDSKKPAKKVATTVEPVKSNDLPPLPPLQISSDTSVPAPPAEMNGLKPEGFPALPKQDSMPELKASDVGLPPLPVVPDSKSAMDKPEKKPEESSKKDEAPKPIDLASLPLPVESGAAKEDTSKTAKTGTPESQIIFNATETEVPLSKQDALNTLAESVHKNKNMRVTVMAYAGGGDDSGGSFPKRVSLARGVAVRAYVGERIEAKFGEEASKEALQRINVKAMGSKNPGGAADRVDIFVIK